jgi:hypothetical protein
MRDADNPAINIIFKAFSRILKNSRHYYIYILTKDILLKVNLNLKKCFLAPTFRVTSWRAGVLLCACGASSTCAAVGLPLGLAGPIGRAYSFVCGLPTGLSGPICRAYSFVCGLPLPFLAGVCNWVYTSPVCALSVLLLAPISRC